MTEDKARKRAIRRRMDRTGERYTAARRHVVRDRVPLPPRVAEPGFSEESVRGATGRGWDDWFRILDEWGAAERRHADIARYLNRELGVSGWWSQSVTVGYERARGLRAVHETTTGFTANVSKTMPVDVETLFAHVAEEDLRDLWLEPGTLRVRRTLPHRSARFDFRDDGSRVVVSFDAKGPAKATIYISHEKLAGTDAVLEAKAFWRDALARLGQVIAG